MLTSRKLRCVLWVVAGAAQACVLNPHGEDPSFNERAADTPIGNLDNGAGSGGASSGEAFPGTEPLPPPATTDPVAPGGESDDADSSADAGALPNPDAARRKDAGHASELVDGAATEAP